MGLERVSELLSSLPVLGKVRKSRHSCMLCLLCCSQGVPPTLRSWVWMECSGAAARKAAVGSKYYANMVLAGEKSPFLKEIDKVSSRSLCLTASC